MVAPQRESGIDEWIEFAEKLSPVENLALVGLLFLRPNLPPSIITPSTLVTEENISSAERWALTRFRQVFAFYCDNYKKHKVALASEALKRVDLVKILAPLLVTAYSVPLGIAVGFLFWALTYGLDNWCQKYGSRKFNGEGKYVTDLPGVDFEGFFDLTYLPAITETVENPESYPLKGYKVVLKAAAETKGLIKVSSSEEVTNITLAFKGKDSHYFSFTDTTSQQEVEGNPENVFPEKDEGPNIVGFTATELIVK
jgi:hypothetical protein